METNGVLLRMKYSAGTVAGWCDRMFWDALLVRVGLLGFLDSQNGGRGCWPSKRDSHPLRQRGQTWRALCKVK